MGLGESDGGQSVLSAQVPEKAEDQVGGDPARIGDRRPKPVHEDLEPDAAFGMSLGIEEDLGVTYPVGLGPDQVRRHQVVEVVRGLEDSRALVVDVEK